MKSGILALTLAVALVLGGGAPASAQATTDAFSAACNANPDFFDFKIETIAQEPERLAAICGCLVTGFAGYSEADLGMLTKDVSGAATADDRTAYGDYTALEQRALVVLDACVLETAGPALAEIGTADMAPFTAACGANPVLLDAAGGAPEQLTVLCGCLVEILQPRISSADAKMLTADLDGTATEQAQKDYAGYDALAELAGGALDECFAKVAPPPTP